jgi:hypothetical protein
MERGMQPGDLRRFKDNLGGTANDFQIGGKTFMVLENGRGRRRRRWRCVRLLMDGVVVGPLGIFWVEQNSEVISEG